MPNAINALRRIFKSLLISGKRQFWVFILRRAPNQFDGGPGPLTNYNTSRGGDDGQFCKYRTTNNMLISFVKLGPSYTN